MKKIPLTQGKFALVDDTDYKWLNQWKWHTNKQPRAYYARRDTGRKNGKTIFVLMHRLILGLNTGDGLMTDHIDSNGLNNQRSNLRICNASQNSQNQRIQRGRTSKHKGVCWDKGRNKWMSRISINGKEFYLGRFDNEIEAAKVYNQAAIEHFGEFALLNRF